jgi:hypothetical protein
MGVYACVYVYLGSVECGLHHVCLAVAGMYVSVYTFASCIYTCIFMRSEFHLRNASCVFGSGWHVYVYVYVCIRLHHVFIHAYVCLLRTALYVFCSGLKYKLVCICMYVYVCMHTCVCICSKLLCMHTHDSDMLFSLVM